MKQATMLGGVLRNSPRFFCLCIATLILSSCTTHEPVIPEEVQFKTSDGYNIVGTLYRPKNEKPPGLILIHMLNSDRSAWGYFAQRAANAGYLSLAYNIRGHGGSRAPDGKPAPHPLFDRRDWHTALLDVAAAKQALLEAGADPDNIAIVGASIGANLALLHAQKDAQIQAAVLVSPGTVYAGLAIAEAMKEFHQRPVLLLTSEGDSYSAASSTRLKSIAPGFSELRIYPGMAHGTDLLDERDEATTQILRWLKPIIQAK